MAPELDRDALLSACKEVAKATLWQCPNPRDLRDIIDTDQIEQTVAGYFKDAHRATGEEAAEFRGTATKSLQNFGAPGSRLEIPEWFGRPYSVVAL